MANDLLHWGKHPQLVFESANEYYRALGHLTNAKAYSISYEDNKKNGSYSDAFRIHILSQATNIPRAFQKKITTNDRINCNQYVENLINNHNFIREGKQIYCLFENVIKSVPNEFVSDFSTGYSESSPRDEKHFFSEKSIVKEKESDLTEVNIPKNKPKRKSSGTKKSKTKKDYLKEQIKNTDIGNRGEKIVFDTEKRKLETAVKAGRIENVDKYLIWKSIDNDGAGYDIQSFDVENMQPIFIEVKTTTGNEFTPFYMSQGEVEFSAKNSSQYRLYRLFNLRENSAKYYELTGDISNNDNVVVTAKDHTVTLK